MKVYNDEIMLAEKLTSKVNFTILHKPFTILHKPNTKIKYINPANVPLQD